MVIAPSLTLFTDPDSTVFAITMDGFPIYAVSFLLMGISIFASALFTALSNGLVSAVISFARTFLFLVGMLMLLPELWGETGIWAGRAGSGGPGRAGVCGFPPLGEAGVSIWGVPL